MIDENKKKVLIKILKYYLITRIVLSVLLIVFHFLLPSISSEYKDIFMLFDNEHYINIAIHGYTKNYEYAFFPLIPILIKILGKWGFLIFNQLLTIGSSYLLYTIDKDIFKNKDNFRIVLLWLVSPISIFTMMFYTEGIFIFLTLLGYLLYKKKKNYLLLGITLGLSVMTRSVGCVLFLTIFIFMMINVFKKKEKFSNVLITYIPATIISSLYPVFLYYKTGDLLYFITIQGYWLKVKSNIFMLFIDSFRYTGWNIIPYSLNYILTLFLFIYIIYKIIKKRKETKYYEIFTYMILTLIMISFSIKGDGNPLTSYYRYIFGCFSIYVLLDRKYTTIICIAIFTLFVSVSFLSGYYFY